MTAKTLLSYLKGDVQIADHKRRMSIADIHIWQEHNGLSDEEIVERLAPMIYVGSKTEACQWFRRYKEHKMAEAEKKYLAEIEKLSSEIEAINKTLARMENR